MFWSKQVSKNRILAWLEDYKGKVIRKYVYELKGGEFYCNGKLVAKKDPNYIEVLKLSSDTIFYKDKKGKVTIIKEVT